MIYFDNTSKNTKFHIMAECGLVGPSLQPLVRASRLGLYILSPSF